MSSYRTALGQRGEALAAALLETRGYSIVRRNYHCRFGEIDVICTHNGATVFCEVKLRRSGEYGTPEEAVTPRKLQKLALSAQTYLAEHDLEDADWRIDVVAIEIDRAGRVIRSELYQGVGS